MNLDFHTAIYHSFFSPFSFYNQQNMTKTHSDYTQFWVKLLTRKKMTLLAYRVSSPYAPVDDQPIH